MDKAANCTYWERRDEFLDLWPDLCLILSEAEAEAAREHFVAENRRDPPCARCARCASGN